LCTFIVLKVSGTDQICSNVVKCLL
jgi:hypothetical protein